MRFTKGQSGNPNGRPMGSLNKHSELVALLEPYADSLVKKAVELALNGDTNALRLCIERLIPKARPELDAAIIDAEVQLRNEMLELRNQLDEKYKRPF